MSLVRDQERSTNGKHLSETGTGAGLSLVSTPQLIQKKKTLFQGLCRVNETHKLHHHDKVPAQGEGLKIFKIIILISSQTESSHSLHINS